MTFKLNFAPHLGFPGPVTPLFDKLVGSVDPVDHIHFAADHGFRWVQDPFTAMRSVDEQRRVGRAAAERGLSVGCFIFAPPPVMELPLWVSADAAALDAHMDEAFAIAQRLGSRHIAVLAAKDPALPRAEQVVALTENLHRIGSRAEAEGFRLCIEAVHARRLPDMLLSDLLEADAIVRVVGLPSVRLIFDFGHVQAMNGDLLYHLDLTWDRIEIVQVTDSPGRIEPGAGEINVGRLLDELVVRQFSGACELEHGWSDHSADHQRAYLDWIGRW